MDRRRRDVEREIHDHGLTIVSCTTGAHWKYRVRNAQGLERVIVFAISGSDHRAIHQQRKILRRIAKETPGAT
jgi:hypothetical protein